MVAPLTEIWRHLPAPDTAVRLLLEDGHPDGPTAGDVCAALTEIQHTQLNG